MNFIKRILNRCEAPGCRKEAAGRLRSAVGSAGGVMTLFFEKRYCAVCGFKKIIEYGKSKKVKFDIDEEFRSIIESDKGGE